MSRRALACALALVPFLIGAGKATLERRAFEGVPFGTSREALRDALVERLDIDIVQGFSGVDYRGPDGLRMIERPQAVVIHRYRLDGLRTDVALVLNANDRFCRVEYEAPRRPASYFGTMIHDDAVAFSKSFEEAFGRPTFRMKPKLVEMRPGSRNYFWRWTQYPETIYTAITAGDNDFGAVAVVSDDALLFEEPAPGPP